MEANTVLKGRLKRWNTTYDILEVSEQSWSALINDFQALKSEEWSSLRCRVLYSGEIFFDIQDGVVLVLVQAKFDQITPVGTLTRQQFQALEMDKVNFLSLRDEEYFDDKNGLPRAVPYSELSCSGEAVNGTMTFCCHYIQKCLDSLVSEGLLTEKKTEAAQRHLDGFAKQWKLLRAVLDKQESESHSCEEA